MLEGKTLCEQARFACQQNCVIMNSSNRRIVSPAEVSFKKPWKKKKKRSLVPSIQRTMLDMLTQVTGVL